MKLQYSKYIKVLRPVQVLQPKGYSYIPELHEKLKRKAVPGAVCQALKSFEDNHRNIASQIALIPKPTLQEALAAFLAT